MNCRNGTGWWPAPAVRDVQVAQRPRGGMPGHPNQLARSSGSLPAAQAGVDLEHERQRVASACRSGDGGSWCSASARPIQASGLRVGGGGDQVAVGLHRSLASRSSSRRSGLAERERPAAHSSRYRAGSR